ncbi:MAG: archaellin/type IV pilin N-terminal domain-containing protein [Candidatus Bathyarchaeia archaeon]
MKVLGRKLNKKAVSPVIATLLMIAIAVAASILVYVWSMGLVGSLQGTGGEQTKEQLIMEAYVATSNTSWTLYIRNVGPTTSRVAAVYVEGYSASFSPATFTLTPGQSGTLTVTVPSGPILNPGAAYTVKIVTTSGAVFSYSVIYGRSG